MHFPLHTYFLEGTPHAWIGFGADQPEIFLQRVLKQTQAYLEGRGAKAAEKAREGRREADIQAAKAVENIQSTEKEGRDFDL